MSEAIAPYRLLRLCVISMTFLVAVVLVVAVATVPTWQAESSSDLVHSPAGLPTTSGGGVLPTTLPRSTSTTSTVPTISPESAGLTALSASDFSIRYPVGWTVEKQDVVPAGTAYRDTTIKRDVSDPHYVVRVDVASVGTGVHLAEPTS